MRVAVKSRARPHKISRNILLMAFAKVLCKRLIDVNHCDSLTPEKFVAAWRLLGVRINTTQALQIFDKYGQNSEGRLPVLVFCEALLVGAPRLAMMSDNVKKGCFDEKSNVFNDRKIIYPQCKKGVFAPSDFDTSAMKRSSQPPNINLSLEFVYGYDGIRTTSNNIFTTDRGLTVYYAAAVGIVYDRKSNTQKFFMGHDDDILCAAISTCRKKVATGQCGKDPCVIVWDPHTLVELRRLYHGYGYRGIQAVTFSTSGSKLATIATDNSHSISIWDLKEKEIIVQRKTQPGAPPAVYGVQWSRFEPARLITFGQNHIKFWRLKPSSKNSKTLDISVDSGKYGKYSTHCILCACFLPSGIVLTGSPEGKISTWKDSTCLEAIQAHGKGPVVQRPDGLKTFGGIRCFILHPNQHELTSGGSDGYLKSWDVSNGRLGDTLRKIPVLEERLMAISPPQVRGLDYCKGSESFIVGTNSCDIIEVSKTSKLLIFGHKADIYGVAMNPKQPHVFATICESENVAVWNSKSRKVIRVLAMGQKAMCGAFSHDGSQLSIGMKNGGIKVFTFGSQIEQVAWCKTFQSAVKDMKYSPNDRYLAAASHDQFIDIFDAHRDYKRISRCSGHSSTVLHIDWSVDGDVLQSNDQAYEILHFCPRNGELIKESQRDTLWASWTCVLGFPVMGIWPKDSDGTDVNACDRSPSEKYLATADDSGKVKLFNYPCVWKNAPSATHGGHSSHVMNVRWARDESYVVSVGGRDRSVFQWKIQQQESQAEINRRHMKPVDSAGIFLSP